MKVKPFKIKIKEPTQSAADRLYAKQQAIRKQKGLPDPAEYKKKLDTMKSEEVEQLDEIGDTPAGRKTLGNYINRSHESGDAARIMTAYDKDNFAKHAKTVAKRSSGIAKAVTRLTKEELEQLDELSPATKSSYVSKAKEQIKQSMPYTKKGEEYRDIAKNFIEKRKRGIAKANESVTVGRAVGRGNIYQYDRNPGPKDGSELENTPSNPKTELQKRLKTALTDLGNKLKETHPKLRENVEQLDEKKKLPGLWANIHAKRKRGEPPAKPGDKDYPKTLKIESSLNEESISFDELEDMRRSESQSKSRKSQIVKAAAKKIPSENQFQANPILDSDVNPQTNKQ